MSASSIDRDAPLIPRCLSTLWSLPPPPSPPQPWIGASETLLARAFCSSAPPPRKKRKIKHAMGAVVEDETQRRDDDDDRVYWIVLATHTLQRLLALEDDNDDDDDDIPFHNMAWLSFAMATVLLAPFSSSTSSSTSNTTAATAKSPWAKHVLGLARLVVTCAATLAYARLAPPPLCEETVEEADVPAQPMQEEEEEDPAQRIHQQRQRQEPRKWSSLAAFTAWDIVMDAATSDTAPPLPCTNDQLHQAYQQHILPLLTVHSLTAQDWSLEDRCWRRLEPLRRPARRPDYHQLLLQALRQANNNAPLLLLLETRLALPRWAPVAWQWYWPGPRIFIQTALGSCPCGPNNDDWMLSARLAHQLPILAQRAGARAPRTTPTHWDATVRALAQHVTRRCGLGETVSAGPVAPAIRQLLHDTLRRASEDEEKDDDATKNRDWPSFLADWSAAADAKIDCFVAATIVAQPHPPATAMSYALTLCHAAVQRRRDVSDATSSTFPWPPPVDAEYDDDAAAWDAWMRVDAPDPAAWSLCLGGPAECTETLCTTLTAWWERRDSSSRTPVPLLQRGPEWEDAAAHAGWCVLCIVVAGSVI